MQQVQLSIPSPCHENWDKMTADAQGKFCQVCAKQVIDFTSLNDEQVLTYFTNKENSNNTCGRMQADQLERKMYKWEFSKSRKWYLNIAAFFFLLFGKPATAQDVMGKVAVQEIPVKNPDTPKHTPSIFIEQTAISWKVLDSRGVPVAYASITFADGKTVRTNKDGGAVSLINEKQKVFIIDAAGYVSRQINCTRKTHYTITLQSERKDIPVIMGKIMVQR